MTLKEEVNKLFGSIAVTEGKNNEFYLPIEEASLQRAINSLAENYFELTSLFCAQNFLTDGFTLFYIFERSGFEEILYYKRLYLAIQLIQSPKNIHLQAWYEREIADGFGICFQGAFDTRRLFLHETYPPNFHPLLKSFTNTKINTIPPVKRTHIRLSRVKG